MAGHQSVAATRLGPLTPIPLAYGAFCAAFDWYMAGYFYSGRAEWRAAWQHPDGTGAIR